MQTACDVEGDAIVDAERRLDLGRGRREGLVGGRGGEHDQVDVARVDAGMLERAARRLGRKGRGRLAFAGDIAAADAGPLDDPFVGRVDGLRELLVGDPALGQRAARRPGRPNAASLRGLVGEGVRAEIVEIVADLPGDVVADHARGDARSRWRRPWRLAPPWLFTTRPLRPRKTAPL